MKMTSAEVNKLLRKLNDERDTVLEMERQRSVFVAATVENVEDARPAYSYEETREKNRTIDENVRALKHALNRFNVTQEIPEIGMTIDQALVYIPQLSHRKRILAAMRAIPEKKRNTDSRFGNLIEYTYANYDLAKAEADFTAVVDELARIQNALDLVNSTIQFETDL